MVVNGNVDLSAGAATTGRVAKINITTGTLEITSSPGNRMTNIFRPLSQKGWVASPKLRFE